MWVTHRISFTGLLFTQAGTLVSCSHDETAQRLLDEELPDVVLRGHQDAIWCADVSRSGRFLATGAGDHTIRLWDMYEADPNVSVRVLRGHDTSIRSLTFSADEKTLYSVGDDGIVRAWNLDNDQVLSNHRKLEDPEQMQNFAGGFLKSRYYKAQPQCTTNNYLLGMTPDRSWRLWNIGAYDEKGTILDLGELDDVRYSVISNDGSWAFLPIEMTLIQIQDSVVTTVRESLPYSFSAWFDPQSRYLLTTDMEGKVDRWNSYRIRPCL